VSASLDVVGIGANSVDFVYRLPGSPRADSPTAKMRIRSHTVSCGGQMATALSACAAMGLRVAYVGAIGTDDNGRRIRDALDQRGLDLSHCVVHTGTNQFAVIAVDDTTGERIVLWDRDDRLMLDAGDIPADLIASARAIHVDDVDQEAAIRAGTMARAAGVPATSDIDRVTDRTEALVAAVSVPIFAEHVPPAITGEPDPERALRKIRRRHPGLLCITLGARGAVVLDGDAFIHEPAIAVKAVDTTGAGDVFRAGFLYAMLRGDSPREMLRFANAAAAVSCTRAGAIDSVPTLDDISRLTGARELSIERSDQ
jgi:sulfofructose kinase